MGEIKSAWEIAMEKVDKLEELTPEELKKQEEDRYSLIGQALADKYLSGLDLRQLEVDLDKYRDKERELLRQVVTSKLASAIELGNYGRLEKVMDGISYLNQMEVPGETVDEFKKLFHEYEQADQKAREELEGSAGEILHQLGISGSAIGALNPKAIGECQQDLDRLAQPYRERLEPLKQRLIQLPPE